MSIETWSFLCNLYGEKPVYGVFEIIFQGLEKCYKKYGDL